jgi:GTP cyclohydrolase II
MSDMKHDAIINSGIKIVERVPIPPELIPKDAQVEIAAKVSFSVPLIPHSSTTKY